MNMHRIVKEQYRAADLPDDLKQGLPATAMVRVVIEPLEPEAERVLSVDELFALRRPPYASSEDIVAEVRRQRDEWRD